MKTNIYLIILALLSLHLSSCDDGDVLTPVPSLLVVEGWAEAGQSPHVLLTSSIALKQEYQSIDSLANHIIRYADVSISDGQQKCYLTGKARNKNYSFPFEYTTGQITCQEGHTYTLQIDYDDYHISATTTIPTSCQLDTIFAVEVSPSLYKIVAIPSSSSNDSSNALFFVKNENTGGDYQYVPQNRNNRGEIELFCPLQLGEDSGDQYFHSGEEIYVKYTNMPSEGKNFWTSYSEILTLSRNFLLPFTGKIDSNVTGGKGYWLGYNSSYYRIIL